MGCQTKWLEDDLKKAAGPIMVTYSITEKRMKSLRLGLCLETSCEEGRKTEYRE